MTFRTKMRVVTAYRCTELLYPTAGDWIVTEANGYQYAVKPDAFSGMYEPVPHE